MPGSCFIIKILTRCRIVFLIKWSADSFHMHLAFFGFFVNQMGIVISVGEVLDSGYFISGRITAKDNFY